jgi:tetratricopeptide (TPR) repeat protein
MARRSAATVAMLWLLGAAAAAIAQPSPGRHTATIRGGQIEVSGPIVFQIGKPGLLALSEPVLDAVAATILASRPPIHVEIGVHSDSMGSEIANLQLSQARADAVKAHLVGRGVPASRLAARGFGETRPIATNTTAEGRAKNRRVELLVVAPAAVAASPPAAQPPAPAPAPAPAPPRTPPSPPSTQDLVAAKELYLKGLRAYDAGDFDHAVQFFLGAYALMPSPQLLYNVAQAFRARGDRQLALEHYRLYLVENPKGPIADRVRREMAELRKQP